MTTRRLIAVIFIFACVTLAWVALGTSLIARTNSGYDQLDNQVVDLWGAPHTQEAPMVTLIVPERRWTVDLDSSDITVDFHLAHRRKGLLWYATYDVGFDGLYTLQNPLDTPVTTTVSFKFPSSNTIYDDFEFRINDLNVTPGGASGLTLNATQVLSPHQELKIHVAYNSRGLDYWKYRFANGITTVKDFSLVMNTDFDGFNFPSRTLSPSTKTKQAQGWELEWAFTNLVSDFNIGLEMPNKLNPGPLASRLSYFAPVSLLFFFTVLVVFGAVKGTNLHPMHYFFLGAAFFAFHLLFAYLVDHVLLEVAFVISAVVSMALVISYLWRVVGRRFALREAGLSQFFFLVLFSYAFFFEGYTGLVVTIGAIITLAVLMQVTAEVDWARVFTNKKKEPSS